jgi:hypothetical protein
MPIEIKELHIHVAVNTSQSGQPSGNQATVSETASVGGNDTKEAIVAECVEQVLRILENKTER